MKRLIILLTTISFCSCKNNNASRADCFGASSPIDLTMVNDCDSDKIVGLYQQTHNDNFELIKLTTVERSKQLTICIENEGPVVSGLFLKMDSTTKLIKLNYGIAFKLNLCDSAYLTTNIEIE